MLSLLGSIYGMISDLRSRLYEGGVFETHDLGARTISVGNITAGGTGKTPLVNYVAGLLAERGEKVCILTRGYGRQNPNQGVLVSDGKEVLADVRQAGDEPYELARKLIGKAIVIADANRVSAAKWAKNKFDVTTFVLDDGFQHRRAKRDVDIVCLDATDPFGGEKMLPAGRLREPLHNLKRADIIILMRADLDLQLFNLQSDIKRLATNTAVFEAEKSIVAVCPLDKLFGNASVSTGISLPSNSFAFCGLGNPQNFYHTLNQAGAKLAGIRPFPDHHKYNQSDVVDLEKEASATGATSFLTTAKDAVKLGGLQFQLPCYVVEIGLKFDNAEGFAKLL